MILDLVVMDLEAELQEEINVKMWEEKIMRNAEELHTHKQDQLMQCLKVGRMSQ